MSENITSVQEWQSKKKTRPFMLPSGAIVQVKESRLGSLVLANYIPLPLLAKVIEGKAKPTGEDAAEMAGAMKKILQLVMRTVASPRIVMDQADESKGEISITDIPDEDLAALIKYVTRSEEAEALGPFRKEQGSPAPGPDVRPVRAEAVSGDKAVGG